MLPTLLAHLRLLIATAWVGSLWTVGYLAAPALFATLQDRVLAGMLAGTLFRIEAWLSVACAVALALLLRVAGSEVRSRAMCFWLIGGMLACTLAGYFGLQPFMSALKEAAGSAGVMESGGRAQFAMLHGIASVLYLVESVLGVALILKIR